MPDSPESRVLGPDQTVSLAKIIFETCKSSNISIYLCNLSHLKEKKTVPFDYAAWLIILFHNLWVSSQTLLIPII